MTCALSNSASLICLRPTISPDKRTLPVAKPIHGRSANYAVLRLSRIELERQLRREGPRSGRYNRRLSAAISERYVVDDLWIEEVSRRISLRATRAISSFRADAILDGLGYFINKAAS